MRFSDPNTSDIRTNVVTYDDDFIPMMKFKIVEGRPFQKEFNDSLQVIINQAFAKEMGPGSPIGKKLRSTTNNQSSPENTIIGVVEDFNFASLHSKVSPLIIFNGNSNFVPSSIAIRSNSTNYQTIQPQIEAAWKQFVPDQTMRLSYLNEELYSLYEADRNTERVFNIFTYIAIFIAFVGLFSLAAYAIQLRLKEISVRKVLGASFGQIFILLSKNFVLLVFVALALSIPVSYYGVQQWLGNFAYHIEIEWLDFIKTGGIALLLVLTAISYQSIKIALTNPAGVLKSD